MKFQDVKDALEHNGKCSINNYIFELKRRKDKAGRTLSRIYMVEVGVNLPGSEEEWTGVFPEFNSFSQFRYWLAQHQYIED